MFKNIFSTKNKNASTSSVSSSTIFAIKEAYKTVRTNILLNLENKPCHVIAITSSIPGEGKSTSSINLAISIAQFDKKVLMIDADLRKKRSSKYLKYSSALGLVEVLKGDAKFEDVVNTTKYQNFDFLSSGGHVINPAEMLASKAMNNLLESLKEKYDFILIDTPPVTVVSDALPVIKSSDGVVLVARELMVTYKEFEKLVSSLEMIQANVLGIIYIGTDDTVPYYHSKSYKNSYDKYERYSSVVEG